MALILSSAQMVAWESRLLSEDFAFDYETESIEKGRDPKVLGVSLATKDSVGYLPLDNCSTPGFNKKASKLLLKNIMRSSKLKIAHFLQFDLAVSWQLGLEVAEPFGCTMIAAFDHDCSRHRYSLSEVSKYYHVPPAPDFGDFAKDKSMLEFSAEELAKYSEPHARNTYLLHTRIEKILKSTGQWSLYWDIDVPAIPSVVEIERNGAQVDLDLVDTMSYKMVEEERKLKNEIYEIAGESFNIRPSDDLIRVLYKKLRLPVLAVTPKGRKPKTDEDTLSRLDHPIVKKILEHRSLEKLRNTFIDPLGNWAIDGRVHGRLNMAVARSGRFSSSEPNLQNIPHYDKHGIRRLFIAAPGNSLSVADYSQIEMRLAAIISGDPELTDIYMNNGDIHSKTCSALFGKVTPELRGDAKTINFAVGYGMWSGSLAAKLGISQGKAQEYLNRYWSTYHGLRDFNKFQANFCRINGDTRTLGGRRRLLPKIDSGDRFAKMADERLAINHPIQGTAADILKLSQTALYKRFHGTGVKLVLSVHDELVLEGPKDSIKEINREQCQLMETCGGKINFNIPLTVEGSTGPNWKDTK